MTKRNSELAAAPPAESQKPTEAEARERLIAYLTGVMDNPKAEDRRRDKAAIALLTLLGRLPDGSKPPPARARPGKKAQRKDDAKTAAKEGAGGWGDDLEGDDE